MQSNDIQTPFEFFSKEGIHISNHDNPLDIFIAISHGQHRGILKTDFIDDRVSLINKLTKKVSYNIFGHVNNPVWGQQFFDELSKCSMASVGVPACIWPKIGVENG